MLNEIVYFCKMSKPMHFVADYMEPKAAFLPKTKKDITCAKTDHWIDIQNHEVCQTPCSYQN